MFGIIYLITSTLGKIGSKINETVDNIRKEKKTTKEYYGHKMWIDRKGRFRDSNTGEQLTIGTIYGDPLHHTYILDSHRRPIKDITQEAINKAERENKEKCIKNNGTAYQIDGFNNYHTDENCQGLRYRDINNNKIYVIRKWNGIGYYMDISNGMFVRMCDTSIKIKKETMMLKNIGEYNPNDDIRYIEVIKDQNERQKRFVEKNKRINYLNDKDPNKHFLNVCNFEKELFV